ncbi:hypothetical protein GTGU_02086 [Trabulsiella guamensis ATCC 49490]|uniref:Uncharacterized protein n=1 Tax=Trabulsiella guamensis ATCC 49490 TaxID=1005994 RepID=A0A085AAB9_9ENTR|nr:hypothetical protein [Trabulsiella guamensis]KFC07164.1 hypothetical protein GTGU_02086 [Trabulsiella guamensis ATCC 49490]
MTTNYVRRYAEDINVKNDICDFSGLLPDINGISAISWELPNCSRREFGAFLLKEMYSTVTDGELNCYHVMVQLVPEQPDTAIVNYKKTWGLIENSGIKVNNFQDKRSFIDKGRRGLILTGTCRIVSPSSSELQRLINTEEKLFFSNIPPDMNDADTLQTERLTKWIEDILCNNGVVFFLLGRFDETDSEIVAIGKSIALEKLI